MGSFEVTDEGAGIIRVDPDIPFMRKATAESICAEVDEIAQRYDGGFKILMNMGAMSKGSPAAGFYTVKRMKEYDLKALALFRANRFMRGMARTFLAMARFSNFSVFDDEADARAWLEQADAPRSVRRRRTRRGWLSGGRCS
jgi:hypothetical protein